MSFVERKISVIITLDPGNFGDAAMSNTITLDAGTFRISVSIVKGPSPAFDWADCRIWGMTPTQMAAASRLGVPLSVTRKNGLQILAGDDESGMALVFAGTIQTASQDFRDSPNVCLNVGAQGGGLAAMAPVSPVSVKGSADVATLMTTIAASMTPPLTLENNGVQATVADPYLPGTATQQMDALARAANCYAKIDADTNTLAIWPKTGSRSGTPPTISAATGLVGYPSASDMGIAFRSLFFPGVRCGALVNLQTQAPGLVGANGTWRVSQLTYSLESQMPGGAWFMDIVGGRINDGGLPQ